MQTCRIRAHRYIRAHRWIERGRAAGYSRSRVALVVRIGKVSNLAGWWLAGVYTFRLPSLRVAGEGGVAKMNAGTARRKGEGGGEREREGSPYFCDSSEVHPSPDRIIDRWMGANGATGSDAPLCGPLLFSSTFPSLLCIIDDSSASSRLTLMFILSSSRERERERKGEFGSIKFMVKKKEKELVSAF